MTGNEDVDPHTIERPNSRSAGRATPAEVAAMIVALVGPGSG